LQDIKTCPGPLEVLNELNGEGRSKIAALRKQIDKLETIGKEQDKKSDRLELLKEVESHRAQLTR
jgi:protein transport protein SEC20